VTCLYARIVRSHNFIVAADCMNLQDALVDVWEIQDMAPCDRILFKWKYVLNFDN